MSFTQSRIATQEGVLVDDIRQTPVDQYENKFRRTLLLIFLGGLILILLGAIWVLKRDAPVRHADIVDHFKYGSIGAEPGGPLLSPVGGVLPPYYVLTALPSLCSDKLPGGYASLGMIYEPGHALPIGVSQRHRLGMTQTGLNCSVCHTGTVRDSPGAAPRIIVGMPAHQFDVEGFFRFVLDCSLDPRVTTETVLAKADGMGWMERQIYKGMDVVDRVKMGSLRLKQQIAPLLASDVPEWGRGRVDTFGPYKAIQFNWALAGLPHDELIGAADFPSLWNQQPREGMHLHWDGNNTSVDERNLSASLGAGVTPVTLDTGNLKRVRDWIWTLPPPKYPYEIDEARAARGKQLYDAQCAECHAFGGAKTGKVTDIAEVGTDPHRLNSYTYTFATNQASLYPDSPIHFTHFRKTNGYANQPLDGVWARAPYLHNGSVPTLADLLEDSKSRPVEFYRGYDVYDRAKVGFVAEGPDAQKTGSHYDTRLPGNGNSGHGYGTDLSASDKKDLIEYLKKL